jgi:hypothetical protein
MAQARSYAPRRAPLRFDDILRRIEVNSAGIHDESRATPDKLVVEGIVIGG